MMQNSCEGLVGPIVIPNKPLFDALVPKLMNHQNFVVSAWCLNKYSKESLLSYFNNYIPMVKIIESRWYTAEAAIFLCFHPIKPMITGPFMVVENTCFLLKKKRDNSVKIWLSYHLPIYSAAQTRHGHEHMKTHLPATMCPPIFPQSSLNCRYRVQNIFTINPCIYILYINKI